MIIHITPLNDLKAHTEDTTCACNPSVTFVEGDMLAIHNSYDGREGLELTMEVLNGK